MKHDTLSPQASEARRPSRHQRTRAALLSTLMAIAMLIAMAPASQAVQPDDLPIAGKEPRDCANDPELCPPPPPDPCDDPDGCAPPEPECPEIYDELGEGVDEDWPADCPPPPEPSCETVSRHEEPELYYEVLQCEPVPCEFKDRYPKARNDCKPPTDNPDPKVKRRPNFTG